MSKYRKVGIDRLASVFGALANPKRLEIFTRLMSCCGPGSVCTAEGEPPKCVGELGQDLGIAPSTVSHHLKELRRVGLIQMDRRGQTVECRINPETIDEVAEFISMKSGA